MSSARLFHFVWVKKFVAKFTSFNCLIPHLLGSQIKCAKRIKTIESILFWGNIRCNTGPKTHQHIYKPRY